MKHTIEYAQCTDDMRSTKTVEAKATGAFNRQFELIFVGAGYEPAGSAMRYVKQCYRVASYDPAFNHRSSIAFSNRADAVQHFKKHTTPITETTA